MKNIIIGLFLGCFICTFSFAKDLTKVYREKYQGNTNEFKIWLSYENCKDISNLYEKVKDWAFYKPSEEETTNRKELEKRSNLCEESFGFEVVETPEEQYIKMRSKVPKDFNKWLDGLNCKDINKLWETIKGGAVMGMNQATNFLAVGEKANSCSEESTIAKKR